MWAIAYLPVRMELQSVERSVGTRRVDGDGARGVVVLEIAGRYRARKWTMPPESEFDDADPEALTFLNLGPDAGHNPQPAI